VQCDKEIPFRGNIVSEQTLRAARERRRSRIRGVALSRAPPVPAGRLARQGREVTKHAGEGRRCLMVAHRRGALTVAVLAVALLVAIGSWEVYQGAEALAQDIHYKCYKIVPSGQPLPPHIVDLTDQFGTQNDVVVTASEYLCAPALKNGAGVPITEFPHLKCYVISRDARPLRQPAMLTDQFGDEDVLIMEPLFFCQEVTKTLP
jgi:hypothetical protein